MVNVKQHVALAFRRSHQLHTYQWLVAHDVEGTAEPMMGILLEVCLRHLASYDGQTLAVVHILSGLSLIINEKAQS